MSDTEPSTPPRPSDYMVIAEYASHSHVRTSKANGQPYIYVRWRIPGQTKPVQRPMSLTHPAAIGVLKSTLRALHAPFEVLEGREVTITKAFRGLKGRKVYLRVTHAMYEGQWHPQYVVAGAA